MTRKIQASVDAATTSTPLSAPPDGDATDATASATARASGPDDAAGLKRVVTGEASTPGAAGGNIPPGTMFNRFFERSIPDQPGSENTLLAQLHDKNPQKRLDAARGLLRAKNHLDQALQALKALAQYYDGSLFQDLAIQTLAAFHGTPQQTEAIDFLKEILTGPDRFAYPSIPVKLNTIRTLVDLGSPGMSEELRNLILDNDPSETRRHEKKSAQLSDVSLDILEIFVSFDEYICSMNFEAMDILRENGRQDRVVEILRQLMATSQDRYTLFSNLTYRVSWLKNVPLTEEDKTAASRAVDRLLALGMQDKEGDCLHTFNMLELMRQIPGFDPISKANNLLADKNVPALHKKEAALFLALNGRWMEAKKFFKTSAGTGEDTLLCIAREILANPKYDKPYYNRFSTDFGSEKAVRERDEKRLQMKQKMATELLQPLIRQGAFLQLETLLEVAEILLGCGKEQIKTAIRLLRSVKDWTKVGPQEKELLDKVLSRLPKVQVIGETQNLNTGDLEPLRQLRLKITEALVLMPGQDPREAFGILLNLFILPNYSVLESSPYLSNQEGNLVYQFFNALSLKDRIHIYLLLLRLVDHLPSNVRRITIYGLEESLKEIDKLAPAEQLDVAEQLPAPMKKNALKVLRQLAKNQDLAAPLRLRVAWKLISLKAKRRATGVLRALDQDNNAPADIHRAAGRALDSISRKQPAQAPEPSRDLETLKNLTETMSSEAGFATIEDFVTAVLPHVSPEKGVELLTLCSMTDTDRMMTLLAMGLQGDEYRDFLETMILRATDNNDAELGIKVMVLGGFATEESVGLLELMARRGVMTQYCCEVLTSLGETETAKAILGLSPEGRRSARDGQERPDRAALLDEWNFLDRSRYIEIEKHYDYLLYNLADENFRRIFMENPTLLDVSTRLVFAHSLRMSPDKAIRAHVKSVLVEIGGNEFAYSSDRFMAFTVLRSSEYSDWQQTARELLIQMATRMTEDNPDQDRRDAYYHGYCQMVVNALESLAPPESAAEILILIAKGHPDQGTRLTALMSLNRIKPDWMAEKGREADAAGLRNNEAGAGVEPPLTPELATLIAQLESPDAQARTAAYVALYGFQLAHVLTKEKVDNSTLNTIRHIWISLIKFNWNLTPQEKQAMKTLVDETYATQLAEWNQIQEKKAKALDQADTLQQLLSEIKNGMFTTISLEPIGDAFQLIRGPEFKTNKAITLIDTFAKRKETYPLVDLALRQALDSTYPQNLRLSAARALVAIGSEPERLVDSMTSYLSEDTRENADVLTIFLNHPDERVKQKASELLSAISQDKMPKTGVLLYATEDGSTLEGLLVRLARAASAKKDDQIADPPDGGGTEEDAVGYYDETILQDEEENRQPLHFTAGWHDSPVSRTIHNPVFHATHGTYRMPMMARLGR